MKTELLFDPNDYEYAEATEAIRLLLLRWSQIDWFVKAEDFTRLTKAVECFKRHLRCARPYLPAETVGVTHVSLEFGSWSSFQALCKSVREDYSRDWRYGVLKRMSRLHTTQCNWTEEEYVSSRMVMEIPANNPSGIYAPGNLIHKFGESIIWASVSKGIPTTHLANALNREIATWYYHYTVGDLIDAVKWQLAERDNDFATNPFYWLIECYALNVYPVCLDEQTVVLWTNREGNPLETDTE